MGEKNVKRIYLGFESKLKNIIENMNRIMRWSYYRYCRVIEYNLLCCEYKI